MRRSCDPRPTVPGRASHSAVVLDEHRTPPLEHRPLQRFGAALAAVRDRPQPGRVERAAVGFRQGQELAEHRRHHAGGGDAVLEQREGRRRVPPVEDPQGGPAREGAETEGERRAVEERGHEQVCPLPREMHEIGHRPAGDERVGERPRAHIGGHHTLWPASGARRVGELPTREVVRQRFVVQAVDPLVEVGVEIDDRDARLARGHPAGIGVGDDEAGLRVLEDHGDLSGRPPGLHRRVDEPGARRRDHDLEVLDPVAGDDRDVVAGPPDHLRQGPPDGPRAHLEIVPRASGVAVVEGDGIRGPARQLPDRRLPRHGRHGPLMRRPRPRTTSRREPP
jgi:hypothetical protein